MKTSPSNEMNLKEISEIINDCFSLLIGQTEKAMLRFDLFLFISCFNNLSFFLKSYDGSGVMLVLALKLNTIGIKHVNVDLFYHRLRFLLVAVKKNGKKNIFFLKNNNF